MVPLWPDPISHVALHPHIISKRADLAAEVSAKLSIAKQYRIAQEERRQRAKIKALEEHQNNELEIQRSELERLHAEREVETARARLQAYDREIGQMMYSQSLYSMNR